MSANSTVGSWYRVLDNPEAIEGPLGPSPPLLDGLIARQIVIQDDCVEFTLEVETFPSHVPPRWKEKSYDTLQYRIGLYAVQALAITGTLAQADKLDISIRHVDDENRPVGGKRQLIANARNGVFVLDAIFFAGSCALYPYARAQYEFAPNWYRI